MHETVVCPGCEAQLTLPNLPKGEAVQCPRCRRVFQPTVRSTSAVTTHAPHAVYLAPPVTEDHELFEQPRRLLPVGSLWGSWLAIVAMLAISGSVVAFSLNAYSEFDSARSHSQERELRALEKNLGARHPEVLALGAAVAAQRNHFLRVHHHAWQWIEHTSWPTIIAFVIWIYAASRNSALLQVGGALHRPAWVLVLYCVPFLNAFIAYVNLQELWKSSDPQAIDDLESWQKAPAGWLVRLIGLNCLCSAFSIFVCFRLDAAGSDYWPAARWLAFVANLNLVIAGVLLIGVIRQITVRQRQRYIRLYEDPA